MRNDGGLVGFEEFLRSGGAPDTPDAVDPVEEFFWKTDYDCGNSRLEEIYKRRAAEVAKTADTRNRTMAKSAKTETTAPHSEEMPSLEAVQKFQAEFSKVASALREKMKDGSLLAFIRESAREHPELVEEFSEA